MMIPNAPATAPQQSSESTCLTQLEVKLAQDADGQYKQQLLVRLSELESALAHKMQGGVPRGQYGAWQAAVSAAAAAREVIEAWTPILK